MKIVGISIGGTKTAVTFADFVDGNILNITKKTFPTVADNDKKEINLIFDAIDSENVNFDFISIIVCSPIDIKKGTINTPPNLRGFVNTPIVQIFKNKYHVDVSLLNDADASALAEFKFGAGKDSKNMAYLTFGTGIGSGLILNGELYTGNNSMAGEIGHVRLTEKGPVGYFKEGSVEGWCAGGNIYKWASVEGVNSTKDIFELARNGNEKALETIDIVAKKIGETVSILLDILNLDKVVIGGIYPRNVDLLEEKVIQSAKENTISINFDNCRIVPSLLNEQIDDYSSLVGVFMSNKFSHN